MPPFTGQMCLFFLDHVAGPLRDLVLFRFRAPTAARWPTYQAGPTDGESAPPASTDRRTPLRCADHSVRVADGTA
ncbi:hypothetical protein [Streptomyces lasiicapitis]|uniref:hypothetical protein n=1 Tax=Streptomyces lasiicapitis TaxID=1923961 RepID=UPI0036835FBE